MKGNTTKIGTIASPDAKPMAPKGRFLYTKNRRNKYRRWGIRKVKNRLWLWGSLKLSNIGPHAINAPENNPTTAPIASTDLIRGDIVERSSI
jgi:hypothetical protein